MIYAAVTVGVYTATVAIGAALVAVTILPALEAAVLTFVLGTWFAKGIPRLYRWVRSWA